MMRKIVPMLTLAGLLAGAAPAASTAAKPVKYAGKTSGGQPIRFTLRGARIINPVAGVPVNCLPIQGGGRPSVGVDLMNPVGWLKVGDTVSFSYEQAVYGFWNEVTVNQRFTSRRGKRGAIAGKLRMQYEFMVPKYPIGTFSIYSCLGNATFTARPRR